MFSFVSVFLALWERAWLIHLCRGMRVVGFYQFSLWNLQACCSLFSHVDRICIYCPGPWSWCDVPSLSCKILESRGMGHDLVPFLLPYTIYLFAAVYPILHKCENQWNKLLKNLGFKGWKPGFKSWLHHFYDRSLNLSEPGFLLENDRIIFFK